MDKPTVQDIFQKFYSSYLDQYVPSPEQAKTANNIINCKTGAYGANVSVCEDCGAVQIHYNSCRNRCCPMCRAVPKEMWMDTRKEDVLDAPYFHLVFTVPDILNPVIYSSQKLLYLDTVQGTGQTHAQIAHAYAVCPATVSNLVKDYVQKGIDYIVKYNISPNSSAALRKLDGRAEAELIHIACGPLPKGHSRWTSRLLNH